MRNERIITGFASDTSSQAVDNGRNVTMYRIMKTDFTINDGGLFSCFVDGKSANITIRVIKQGKEVSSELLRRPNIHFFVQLYTNYSARLISVSLEQSWLKISLHNGESLILKMEILWKFDVAKVPLLERLVKYETIISKQNMSCRAKKKLLETNNMFAVLIRIVS